MCYASIKQSHSSSGDTHKNLECKWDETWHGSEYKGWINPEQKILLCHSYRFNRYSSIDTHKPILCIYLSPLSPLSLRIWIIFISLQNCTFEANKISVYQMINKMLLVFQNIQALVNNRGKSLGQTNHSLVWSGTLILSIYMLQPVCLVTFSFVR